MSNNEGPAVKCGYCGWLMFGSCTEIQAHQCFQNYDENIHVLSIDKTGRATIRVKDTNKSMQMDIPSLESNECTISVDTKDEMLIDAVERRPALWNFKLPAQKRTPTIKRDLWDEIRNNLGFENAAWMKSRWTYLRDCYTKAKKKMKRYIPSGSDAEVGHTQKSSFRFYARMQFLDEVMLVTPTTSSLSCNVSSEEKDELNEDNLSNQESNSIIYSPSCSTPSISERSDSPDDWRLSANQNKRKRSDSQVQSLHTAILEQLLEQNEPKKDAVDCFLQQISFILRKLNYLRRRQTQLAILQILHQAEDEEAEESTRN